MRRLILWGLLPTLVALAAPAAAQATCSAQTPASPIVRFVTTFGNVDVQLNSTDAPCTVEDFLYYVDKGLYNGSFFHRSVNASMTPPEPVVVQGGGYTLANGQPVAIPTTGSPFPSGVTNEFKDSNIAGSLAMAQSGISSATCELDDSATDEWFFNVADNSSSLDQQCFTVFGQVLDPNSMAVVNQIAAAQICSLSKQFNDSTGVFTDVPTVGYSATACAADSPAATAANLIFVKSISVLDDTAPPAIQITSPTRDETLNLGQKVTPSYACSDGTGTGVQSCTAPTTVDTTLYGTLQYTVTAEDYAGNTTTKSIPYIVELPPALTSFGTVSPKGVLWFHVHCPSTVACVGQAALVASKLAVIGMTRFDIRSNGTDKLKIVLTSTGWRDLKAAKWRLRAALAITPSGTGAETSSHGVTLIRAVAAKRPRKHKRR